MGEQRWARGAAQGCGKPSCLRWRLPCGQSGRGLSGWGIPFPWRASGFGLPFCEKRRGKSPPAHLEEPRDQMDRQGLPLMAETKGSHSAPIGPQWGTAGGLAGEAKMLRGNQSSSSGNIVLLLSPTDQSVRELSLWGCF